MQKHTDNPWLNHERVVERDDADAIRDEADVPEIPPECAPARADERPEYEPGALAKYGLPEELAQALLNVGLFPNLLVEVSRRMKAFHYTHNDLQAMLDWCEDDAPRSVAALFIARVRAGAPLPSAYQQPKCSRCGLYGKHASDCSHRYEVYQ